jgi:hypothetical protein
MACWQESCVSDECSGAIAAPWSRYRGFPFGLSGLYIRAYFTADIGIIDVENERPYQKHKMTKIIQFKQLLS